MSSAFLRFLTRSFYIKMILIMLASSIIPLIVLSAISIRVSSTTVDKQVNRLNAQLVDQVVDRIELTMSRFREVSEQYSRITSIQDALVSPSEQYFEEVVRKKVLISVLSTASAIIGNVEGVQVYSAITGEILSSTNAPEAMDNSKYKALIEYYLNSGKQGLFLDKHSIPDVEALDESTFYISRIPYFQYEDLKGVLLISMNNKEYLRQIQHIELGSSGAISLVTSDAQTIATTSKLSDAEEQRRIQGILNHWRELGSPNQFDMGSSIISVKQTATYDKWIVVSEIPSRELNQHTTIIRRTVTYVLVLLVSLGALSVIGFGYHLYRPLQAVKRQVQAIKNGQFDARVTQFANNEIGDLGRMLNTMAVRIQDLMVDLQESEDLKHRLEIRALQSQINPHFMYNTLNTIRMFAMMKDYNRINSLMGRLVSLLRYSMENVEQTVSLQEEVDYLRDYIALLNMRYECQITLQTCIAEPYQQLSIPRLSLQPLIENAVFHGILPARMDQGSIHLRVFSCSTRERIVIIEVGDNGVGMETDALNKLRGHLLHDEIGENIGLQNVWMRMKLFFGSSARITLSSPSDEGLTIRFELEQDKNNVKGGDADE
ncbi:cache domain-containing sensor histidine kinase [Paenibacillus xylanilyticus]|uniref:Histidine kinase n=1 Tax=Paenibacillus xylanilyticus TaxID=248903 RepID=A0A7Y6EWH9_9BACL|nr:sensor histidine kinase [Paenibacillus xylanilyticus]NUU76779.1 histidine kinase [Paenibacillus xylanilyticus]